MVLLVVFRLRKTRPEAGGLRLNRAAVASFSTAAPAW